MWQKISGLLYYADRGEWTVAGLPAISGLSADVAQGPTAKAINFHKPEEMTIREGNLAGDSGVV